MLLTWDIESDLNAGLVEKYIFNKLGDEKRMNSTMRAFANRTEHFDVSLKDIKNVFVDAKAYYQDKYGVKIHLDEPKSKNVRTSVIKGKKNVTMES